ncbi:hypothetical protein Tco_1291631 [Tanacetum coccineum]
MEYAPNQLEAKAAEPVDEVVVTNPLEPEVYVVHLFSLSFDYLSQEYSHALVAFEERWHRPCKEAPFFVISRQAIINEVVLVTA